uniref:Uncharacterized protein n=1 Tax=Megaselia scalaris TaxID=36166 RepID=T1GEU9_MEGSC
MGHAAAMPAMGHGAAMPAMSPMGRAGWANPGLAGHAGMGLGKSWGSADYDIMTIQEMRRKTIVSRWTPINERFCIL